MKNFISIMLLCWVIPTMAQYTPLSTDITGEDAPTGYEEKSSYFYGTSLDYAIYEFSNILRANIYNKRQTQEMSYRQQQSMAKLTIIKSQYEEYKVYPDSIIDGWHNAIATDNMNFCKEVKVLVKNNRIKRFIIDDYVPLNFTSTRPIKKAKCVVTLQNFNHEQLNVVEVYFLYDIDEQTIVPKPMTPGVVCFYTSERNLDKVKLIVDGIRLEKFTVNFDKYAVLPCFAEGMICRIMKPGMHSFVAQRFGSDYSGTFEVKEGMCLQFHLFHYLK